MNTTFHLTALATLARCVLEADDVERMVMPAIADAVAETSGRSTARGAASLTWQVANIIALASFHRLFDAAKESSWWPLIAATVAGVAGSVGLQCTDRGSLSLAQLVFVLIGGAAAALVVTAPTRIARTLGMAILAITTAALASVPWVGFAHLGVHRWLRLGPIAVHASVLGLPVFAVLVARITDRWSRPAAAVLVLGVIALLLAQPDSPAAVVYAVTAVGGSWRSRARGWVLAASVAGVVAALSLHAPLPPVAHVEGALRLLAAQGPLWLAMGVGALGSMLVLTFLRWRELARSNRPSSHVYERQAAAATTAMAALTILPRALGDGGLPLIAFGGSAVVATCVLTAIVIRSSRYGARSRCNSAP